MVAKMPRNRTATSIIGAHENLLSVRTCFGVASKEPMVRRTSTISRRNFMYIGPSAIAGIVPTLTNATAHTTPARNAKLTAPEMRKGRF